jgi:hypothetical protein
VGPKVSLVWIRPGSRAQNHPDMPITRGTVRVGTARTGSSQDCKILERQGVTVTKDLAAGLTASSRRRGQVQSGKAGGRGLVSGGRA